MRVVVGAWWRSDFDVVVGEEEGERDGFRVMMITARWWRWRGVIKSGGSSSSIAP